MPIPVDDAKKFSGSSDIEIRIVKFLESHTTEAQSSDDIGTGIGYVTLQFQPDELRLRLRGNYWNRQNVGKALGLFLDGIDLDRGLERLVRKGTIKASIIDGTKYYNLA